MHVSCCSAKTAVAAATVLAALIGWRAEAEFGKNEALRTYTEFADGANRGLYDPETDSKGYPDEDYDATTAMVINWHAMPEDNPDLDGRLQYRRVHPQETGWSVARGESQEFWHREELIHRVILTDLEPGSVYEYQVAEAGRSFHFRTLPASLEERSVRIAFTGDHQSPGWNEWAHANAELAAAQQPDMFVMVGDYLNCEGRITEENAGRWADYLDYLYGADEGYFLYGLELDGTVFENVVIPHVSVLGNHETGHRHHLRWPACVNTGSSKPGYPEYVAANWMQLLFHWPYSSEGFYSEFNPDHPNMDPEHIREGFGKGGFGSLRFSDYLLLIALDNNQNFEGEPDIGLRDWEGNLITDTWPWYETIHADIRQDKWLHDLLEPEGGPPARDAYTHIIPMWHRGMYGLARTNMSLKDRALLKYWMPVIQRSGARFIKEAHEHNYTRTVPLTVTDQQPENTSIETIPYEPSSWPLTDNLPQDYIDDFYSAKVLRDNDTGEIVGWTYAGYFTHYHPQGLIVQGHGGWAGGRQEAGNRGGGNAGRWHVDESKGGANFAGDESFHITTVDLRPGSLTVTSLHPHGERPIHKARWDKPAQRWLAFDFDAPDGGAWIPYETYGN